MGVDGTSMRVDYYLTACDVVTFYDYAMPRTREFRRRVLIGRLTGPPLFFFGLGVLGLLDHWRGDRLALYAFLILAAIISVIWVVAYPSITRDSLRKRIKKICAREEHKK